jgi:hypothetical protein
MEDIKNLIRTFLVEELIPYLDKEVDLKEISTLSILCMIFQTGMYRKFNKHSFDGADHTNLDALMESFIITRPKGTLVPLMFGTFSWSRSSHTMFNVADVNIDFSRISAMFATLSQEYLKKYNLPIHLSAYNIFAPITKSISNKKAVSLNYSDKPCKFPLIK